RLHISFPKPIVLFSKCIIIKNPQIIVPTIRSFECDASILHLRRFKTTITFVIKAHICCNLQSL
ncbi:hypothetical protein L9F63_027939, partial [Diploptera punctata]